MNPAQSAAVLTDDYDRWLAAQIPVVTADLDHKHAEMRTDRFRFLRGTYYLWLARVAERAPDALDTAGVPLVGDLHVENFGTWRDADQVRRWGVNDLDELGTGPWLLDLLRLATSAALAPHIALDDAVVCQVLLDRYATAEAGPDLALADPTARHLDALLPSFASEAKYYDNLAAGRPADFLPAGVVADAARVATAGWRPTWHVRVAGTGSLGHRRCVGVGPAGDGHWHAREAKEMGPGTNVWAGPRDARLPRPDDGLYARVLATVRGPATSLRVAGWQLRDLAPDVVRIELSGLRPKDEARLLTSMARATAHVHAADPPALRAAQDQARALGAQDFAALVATMVDAVKTDFLGYGA